MQGEQLLEEISLEYYLAHSGRKPDANLQPIYERHRDILSEESLALVRQMFDEAPSGNGARRSAQLLLDWQLESQAARELASMDEQIIRWEGSAHATVADGRTIAYQRLMLEISNATDRDERLDIERARSELVASELAPMKRDRVLREMELMRDQHIAPGFVASLSVTSGVDLNALIASSERFLADTADMWNELLPYYLRRELQLERGDATRADAVFLFRAGAWDDAFPGNKLFDAISRQTEEMGLEISAGGRIVLDVEDREGKRARAFCAPVRVPNEVYLVLLPQGGRNDYRTFLHELGHALHFAHADAALPFEFRWLGDNSVTEGYAMLFDHLIQDSRWLARFTEMPRNRLEEHRRRSAFEELHYVRRYCAKILFEAEAYEGGATRSNAADRFVEIMTGATGFLYDACDAFVDFDPRFYSARYLRAWQLQAVLSASLRDRFDEDWFRNPRAGPWIVSELMSHGQSELAHELSMRAAGAELSFDALKRNIEALAT